MTYSGDLVIKENSTLFGHKEFL